MEPDARVIKVLLADDHVVLREGLKNLLSGDPEINVIGEASNGREAVALAEKLKPDVVVTDIGMPEMNGLEATKLIHARVPSAKILVLTQYDTQEYLFTVLQNGASGYVLKRSASSELFWAIKNVYQGAVYLSPLMAQALVREYLGSDSPEAKTKNILTAREQEVLKLIAEGETNQKIADKLFISLKTVQTHRAHILEKLNLHDRTELVKYAIAKGIITVESQS